MRSAEGPKLGIEVRFVPRKMSSDNAAMIALAAYKILQHAGEGALQKKWNININPNLKVKNWGK